MKVVLSPSKLTLAPQTPAKAVIGGTISPKITLAQQKPVKAAVGGTISPQITLAQQRRS